MHNLADRPGSWNIEVPQAIHDLISAGRDQFSITLADTGYDFDAICWNISSLKDRSSGQLNRNLYFTRYQTQDQSLPRIFANVIKSWIILERQSTQSMAH